MFDSQEYRNGGRLVTLMVEYMLSNSTFSGALGYSYFQIDCLSDTDELSKVEELSLKSVCFIFIPP